MRPPWSVVLLFFPWKLGSLMRSHHTVDLGSPLLLGLPQDARASCQLSGVGEIVIRSEQADVLRHLLQ